ncbi:MAG TPA: DUF6510 family protein [Gemmatimonadaceae bacterium]|nr:DUF6510 family protein [Gemmatimonadaceae bacterium]
MRSASKKKATQKRAKQAKRTRDSYAHGEVFADLLRVDGNAAGGLFGELFAMDITAARAKCAGCGAAELVGALLVYAHGMGMVARCPHCQGVVMRMARTPTHVWLDAQGAESIAVAVTS